MILKAEPLDPSFTWREHKPERWKWRSVGVLLAIAVGAGFYVGRISTAAPIATEQRAALEQPTASGSVAQSQGASQSDATATTRSSTDSTDAKLAVKAETTAGASATQAPKVQPAATEKGSSSPPVVLINPSTAEKGVTGEAKKAASKPETEAPAKAVAKTETHKPADDAAPAVTTTKRQARSHSPAHANVGAAPVRQESAARRDDTYAAPRRDDAYVPPRVPQSTLSAQRDRYDNVERDDDRARMERYPERRFAEPDRRYAEDAPPPRDVYDDRREYLRPFQGARDFREYRRFDGYDGDPYGDRRPALRPMNGGGPGY